MAILDLGESRYHVFPRKMICQQDCVRALRRVNYACACVRVWGPPRGTVRAREGVIFGACARGGGAVEKRSSS